jgi:hypothetical protein
VANTPDMGHAYRTATKYNDYDTVRNLGRMETGVGREESGYAARALKSRFEQSRPKKRYKSRGKGRD